MNSEYIAVVIKTHTRPRQTVGQFEILGHLQASLEAADHLQSAAGHRAVGRPVTAKIDLARDGIAGRQPQFVPARLRRLLHFRRHVDPAQMAFGPFRPALELEMAAQQPS